MKTPTIVERIVHDHSELDGRLDQWESALAQLSSSAFSEFERGLQRMWHLVPFFEREMPRHFREEETEFFPAVQTHHPENNPALTRFSAQHAVFTRQWQAYKLELLYCDAVGATQQVCELGTELIKHLRQHMRSEERELLPLMEKSEPNATGASFQANN
jgi:iron-sulfur cluster repair protein YtfE (RIC family)